MITLAQAAEQCGVNRSTLLRSVKSGRISGARDDAGNWTVDPAEAFRVFPPKQPPQQAKADAATDALIAQLHRVIDDLRQDRNQWREIAQRLALPAPRQEPQPAQAEAQHAHAEKGGQQDNAATSLMQPAQAAPQPAQPETPPTGWRWWFKAAG